MSSPLQIVLFKALTLKEAEVFGFTVTVTTLEVAEAAEESQVTLLKVE